MATGYSHQIPGTADWRRASTLSMIRIDVIRSDIELRNYPEEEKYLFFFFSSFFSMLLGDDGHLNRVIETHTTKVIPNVATLDQYFFNQTKEIRNT